MNSYLVNEKRLLIDEAKKNPESGEHNQLLLWWLSTLDFKTSGYVLASGDTASALMGWAPHSVLMLSLIMEVAFM